MLNLVPVLIWFGFYGVKRHQCDNGEYVSQFSTCNGFFDCVDNSDEVNCGELNNDVIGFWCDVRWFIYHININIYIQVRDAHVIFRVIV
jgi:hypothetical protein